MPARLEVNKIIQKLSTQKQNVNGEMAFGVKSLPFFLELNDLHFVVCVCVCVCVHVCAASENPSDNK